MEFISNFNGLELIFIIILAILLFGPEKIPEIAGKLGSWVRTLRNISSQIMNNLQDETGLSDLSNESAEVRAALKETAAEMETSARKLSQQAAGRELPPSGNSEEKRKTQDTASTPASAESREQLEKRLATLENELLAIRSQLAEEDPEKAADSDD